MEGSFPLRKLSPRSTLLNVIYNLTVKQYLTIMKIYHVPATNGENESSMRIKKSNICDGDTKELVLQFSKEYMNLYSTITNVQTVHNLCSQYNIESFLAILNKIIILQSTFLLTRIDFTSCSFKKVVRFCFVFRLIERNTQREREHGEIRRHRKCNTERVIPLVPVTGDAREVTFSRMYRRNVQDTSSMHR